MNEISKIIAASPLFSGLPEGQITEIAEIAIERHYPKGESVFYEKGHADGFYVVMKGLVKIFKLSAEGKEHILHIFGPGEPFGEVPVFTGKVFPANAETISDTRLLFFPRTDFVNLIVNHPSLALNMLAVLSMRLRQFTVQIENLSLKEVPARLAGYLIYLSEEQGSKDVVTLDITKGQLSSLLGTIPETLSRILSKMSSQGLIRVQDRVIHLLDFGKMIDLAENGKLTPNLIQRMTTFRHNVE